MIWSLQILRFVAAMMVVYVHSAQSAIIATGSTGILPHQIAGLGLTGVDIFFVISGVVIAKTATNMTPRQFAWRRLRRIVPIYYLCCIPALLVAIPTGFGWRDLVSTFLFWPATDVMTAPLLAVAWTLCFEMLFYVCAAMALIDRRLAFVLLTLYAIALGLRPLGPVFQFLGNPIIIEFLFGVVVARAPACPRAVWLLPVGVFALLAAGLSGFAPDGSTLKFLRGDNTMRPFIIGIPAALIVYGTMQINAKQGTLTYLGDASYTLYLVHTFAITPLQALWVAVPVSPNIIIILGLATSILLAWRVFDLIEKPILLAIPRQLHGRRA